MAIELPQINPWRVIKMVLACTENYNHLSLTFQSLDHYAFVREKVQEFIERHEIKNSFFIELGINEAINNALLHSKSNIPIKSRLRFSKYGRLYIKVSDYGSGFHGNDMIKTLIEEKSDPFNDRIEEESGRGILLMLKTFDKVIYNSKGNELLLVKKIN